MDNKIVELQNSEEIETLVEHNLLELFNFWYGLKYIPTVQSREKNLLKNIPFSILRSLWIDKWFAKKEKQVIMDTELKKFDKLIDIYSNCLEKINKFKLFEKLALIILYDQIPRNIFRGTSKAYDYDVISRSIALDLAKEIEILPLQFKFTILICLCHSENITHQTFIRDYIKEHFSLNRIENELMDYKELLIILTQIADNHYIRVSRFGRIVERNKYVGRNNTEEENLFMASFK